MDAVDDPVQPRADPVVGLEVEHDPVQPVLEQRPQPVPGDRQGDRDGDVLTFDRLQAASAAIAGPKIRIGTAGCTREQASSRRDSNIGGEALSTSVLLASVRSLGVLRPSHMPSVLPDDRRDYAGSATGVSVRPPATDDGPAAASRRAWRAGGRCRAGAHVGRVGRARLQLDDPKAHDAVGDPQRPVQLARAARACRRGTAAGGTRRRRGARSDTPAPASPQSSSFTTSPAAAIAPRVSARIFVRTSSSAWGSSSSTRSYVGAGNVMRGHRLAGRAITTGAQGCSGGACWPIFDRSQRTVHAPSGETAHARSPGTAACGRSDHVACDVVTTSAFISMRRDSLRQASRHAASLLSSLRADVRELLVDPVAGVARGHDLRQPARAPRALVGRSIVSAA